MPAYRFSGLFVHQNNFAVDRVLNANRLNSVSKSLNFSTNYIICNIKVLIM